MAVETELKLRIDSGNLARLKRCALLKACQSSRPVTRRLYNIYFDTPKLGLHRQAMALRLRRDGRQWLQTLKGGGSVKAGMHSRDESEVLVSRAVLDFSSPETAPWLKLLPSPKKLAPVFVTDFSRNSRMLEWRGAEIELCMDHGEVRCEERSTPICELELELKSGEPCQLFELALKLLEIVPFELEQISKAEQGYRLLSGHAERPARGEAPVFAKTATLGEALQALIWSCLQHLQANLRGAMTGEDDEYLHQMRVALRRLRVVLNMARKFRADEALCALSQEVAALCVSLGRIREWDVFIAGAVRPICKRMTGHAGLQALLAASEAQRAACYDGLRGKTREMQGLMLRLALWMSGSYWKDEGEESVEDFANCRLSKLARRFATIGGQLDTLDEGRLHELRILAKKLRYSAEFFAVLYDRQKPFIAALSDVQEVLGQVNDVVVARRLLDELALMPELAAHKEALALIRGWIAHDQTHQLSALGKAVRRFSKRPVFWD